MAAGVSLLCPCCARCAVGDAFCPALLYTCLHHAPRLGWNAPRPAQKKLETEGYVEVVLVSDNKRQHVCIKLLKPWQQPAEGEGGGDEGGKGGAGAGEDGEEGGEEVDVGGMAEVPLERQMLEEVVNSGPMGLLNIDLFARLGLNPKMFGNRCVARGSG